MSARTVSLMLGIVEAFVPEAVAVRGQGFRASRPAIRTDTVDLRRTLAGGPGSIGGDGKKSLPQKTGGLSFTVRKQLDEERATRR